VSAAPTFENLWVQYSQIANVYFVSQTNWTGHTHYYGIGATGPFSNGYIPMFAVIGAGNVCFYNDNPINNVEAALNLAIESFGLAAHFDSNITNGPLDLGVQFYDSSIAPNGIDSWEWDLDGDGITDSNEQDPFFLYTELGNYDVSLTITSDGETVTENLIDYISVTDASSVSGNVAGIWRSEYGPYTITDDVTIPADGDLTIEPGVEIFTETDKQITVNGILVADGSERENEPIIFSSDTTWNGIKFSDTQAENLLKNCEISMVSGSAISIENDSYVDIIGNIFTENSSASTGAAIDVSSSDNVFISQNIIANNTSSNLTGGIACIDASIEISNNIIVNNSGTYGAFSFKNGSDALLVNNTIANNESTNPTPYEIFIFNAMPIFRNCIITDESDSTAFFAPFGLPECTYTCIYDGTPGNQYPFPGAIGNIDQDPLFNAPSEGVGVEYDGLNADWSLQEVSPCIDAGDPDPIYNDPDGTRNDMGAYGGPNALTAQLGNDDNPIALVSHSNINVYPNPFNPETNIALSLSSADLELPVTVEIYNVKGQLVKTVLDNQTIQNNAKFIWNGTDNNGTSTTSGLYFVKLKTASSTSVVKMILLK